MIIAIRGIAGVTAAATMIMVAIMIVMIMVNFGYYFLAFTVPTYQMLGART